MYLIFLILLLALTSLVVTHEKINLRKQRTLSLLILYFILTYGMCVLMVDALSLALKPLGEVGFIVGLGVFYSWLAKDYKRRLSRLGEGKYLLKKTDQQFGSAYS